MTNEIQNQSGTNKTNSSKLTPGYYLYLDTSELTATLAIFKENEKLAEEQWEAGRELSNTLSKNYSNLLEEAGISVEDLAGVCVFVGPGSFTGLRIGISFANGLAFALEIPVYETRVQGELNLDDPKSIALPFYGAEPRITTPKKK